jgi:hypothetical protein
LFFYLQFAKNDNKHIEEVKMRVALISSPESFVPTPINGVFKQGPFFEPSVLKDSVLNRVEILNPPQMVRKFLKILVLLSFLGLNFNVQSCHFNVPQAVFFHFFSSFLFSFSLSFFWKQGPFLEPSVLKDPVLNRVEIITPPQTVRKFLLLL